MTSSLFAIVLAGIRTGRMLREKADCKESTLLKRAYLMLFAIILKLKCALTSIEFLSSVTMDGKDGQWLGLELEKLDQKQQYSSDIASLVDTSESITNRYRSRDLLIKGDDESEEKNHRPIVLTYKILILKKGL